MPNKEYLKLYNYYWPKASELIIQLLIRNIDKEQTILEVGFGSGHLLFQLLSEGYNAEGCEIREDEYEKTKKLFKQAGYERSLFCNDIMNIHKRYDVIYTTGLIQCTCGKDRKRLIQKFCLLARKVIIVIPEIVKNRNSLSKDLIGVMGCTEYVTTSIAYELNEFFDDIKVGYWTKKELGIEDNFQYFICENLD